MSSLKNCPKCGVESHHTTSVCVCGNHFSDTAPDHLKAIESSTKTIKNTLLWVIIAVIWGAIAVLVFR